MPDITNSDDQSLRGFLQMVEAEFPEELLRINQPVDTRFEMTAMVFELERAGRSPVIIFQNPTTSGMPVITNIAGNRKLLAACLGVDTKELVNSCKMRPGRTS
jgi:2,5-furandicarboxylate decarboxylase 1